jgi:hypothetical protein
MKGKNRIKNQMTESKQKILTLQNERLLLRKDPGRNKTE